jgi:peroxiredoxin
MNSPKNLSSLLLMLVLQAVGSLHSENAVLDSTVSRMACIDVVEYDHRFCLKQDLYDDAVADSVKWLFDFTKKENALGARYRSLQPLREWIYNGNNASILNLKSGSVTHLDNPDRSWLTNNIFLINSLYVLHQLLPIMVKDTSVNFIRLNDTVVGGVENFKYRIILNGKKIDPTLVLKENKGKQANYELLLSKQTFLPTRFSQMLGKGFWEASFSNVRINPSVPDSIWSTDRLERLASNAKQAAPPQKPVHAELTVGSEAPDWSLPSLNGELVRLSDLKGKTVVLEFWFPACAPCAEAIPSLNAIYQRYTSDTWKLYGVEFTNARVDAIRVHVKEHAMHYPILHTADKVSQLYAITGAPTIFLIDKQGIIRYISSGFHEEELLKAIEENL